MFLDEDEDEFVTSGGGVYRVRDNISNFRIRIRVKRIEPYSLESSESHEDVEDDPDEEDESSQQEMDGVTLRWQQKIFSQDELEKYGRAKESDFGDDEVLPKKFYHDVQKIKQEGTKVGRIFTVIDGEISKEEDTFMNDSAIICDKKHTVESEPNYLTSMMVDGLRRRLHQTVIMPSAEASKDGGTDTKSVSSIVIDRPSRETQIRLHTCNLNSSEHMRVKFDAAEGKIVELCSLKLSSNAVLEVIPNFTFNRKPFKIEIDGKVLYEYWIEHISPSMKYEDQLKEALMMNQVLNRHANYRNSEVGKEFESPQAESDERIFRLCLNGEIVSAQDYDYDNLFVHYFVDIPTGWKEFSKDSGHGMTTTCKTNAKDEAHFCTLFSADLGFDINRLDYYDFCTWPTFFIEVLSVDSWTRLRTEGYGFVSIPYLPGTYELKVNTWRPLMSHHLMGRIGEMRRYFTGGTPELEDLTSSYGNASGPVLSRYGSKTVSTGSVSIRLSVIHHSPTAFMMKKNDTSGGKHRRLLLDRLASASLLHSVTSVIQEFGKARERILKASKGLENEEENSNVKSDDG